MEIIDLTRIVKNKIGLVLKNSILLFLINNYTGNSQNLENLNKEDVVFVYFKKNQDLNFYKEKVRPNNKMKTIYYHYIFKNLNKKNKCEKNNFHFWLRSSNYEDFDAMFNNEKTLHIRMHKSFLRRNKSIIINNKFINSVGYHKISKLLRNKQIFLIDEDDTVKNKILIKKVTFSEPPEE